MGGSKEKFINSKYLFCVYYMPNLGTEDTLVNLKKKSDLISLSKNKCMICEVSIC